MDIKEYISSGVLELYVMGALSREETLEVERMAALHEEVRAELNAIETTMEQYARQHSRTPSAALRDKVLGSIEREDITTSDTSTESNTGTSNVVQLESRSKGVTYLAAASIFVALISSGLAYHYHGKWKETEGRLVSLQSENAALAGTTQKARYEIEKAKNESAEILALIADSNTAAVKLKGSPKSPDSEAKVLWNKSSQKVFLVVKSLPAPPPDKQYQLWALKDGKPVDAGVFDVNGNLQLMKSVDGAQAFAVTLENKGGSPVPTLEAMYLIGTI